MNGFALINVDTLVTARAASEQAPINDAVFYQTFSKCKDCGTTVPMLFEQNQFVGAAVLVRPVRSERKQLIEQSFLEQGQAQDL